MQYKGKEKHISWENTCTKNGVDVEWCGRRMVWTKNGGDMCCWTCCISKSVIDLYLRCTKDPYFIINELWEIIII